MIKHQANNLEQPNERLIGWMKSVPYVEKGYTSAGLAKEIRKSQGYIDAIRQGKKPLSVSFARMIAELDREKIIKWGGDPGTAIRWQYLVGEDPFRTEKDYVEGSSIIQAMRNAWEQVQAKELMYEGLFREAGFDLAHDEGGYVLSPKGRQPRRITHETMDGIRDGIALLMGFMAQRAYDTAADEKETTNDGVRTEEYHE